jgi:hypothetical protein
MDSEADGVPTVDGTGGDDGMASRRDAANRWSAQHPFLVGWAAGVISVLLFVAFYGYGDGSGIFISLGVFWVIGTLSAFAERRRRRKQNLPL